jgi:peptidoglycan/xylan/chitin deacetylase (PgdA/CDA1 family)
MTVCALILTSAPCAFAVWNGGHDAMGTDRPGTCWYFAEGTTRAGFSEYICILNPGDAAAEATLSYMLDNGQNVERKHTLPPGSRTTVDVGTEVPPGRDVSVRLVSTLPVVAERSMYFTYEGKWSGGHDVTGIAEPRAKWCFAEGCTREGFDTYLCMQNPNDTEAMVDIRYLCADGKTEERAGVRLAPRSRFTVPVHEGALGIGRHNDSHGDFSITVGSDPGAPVIVERPMYFTYNGVTGGHDAVGAGSPASEWYFAEGCTRAGFDTYLCLANPGDKAASVDIEYYCADGKTVTRKAVRVAPESRFTVPVHEDALGVGRHDDSHGDFSIRVKSANGVPVVAERPMYFSYRPSWNGGSDVVGALEPRDSWYFAEGCTRNGFDTYLCVMNPADGEATVNVSYYCGDGKAEPMRSTTVPGRSRMTIAVHSPGLGIGRNDGEHGDVAIKVETGKGAKVVVERPMYFASRWRTIDRSSLASARGWGEVFKGNAGRRCVALTFDMEGNGQAARAMLDILAQKDVQSTFFILGGFAFSHPDILRRMADEGHEIANHSVSHSRWTRRGPAGLAGELAAVEAAVNGATGFSTKPYFRFPDGDRNGTLISAANKEGYLSVYWSIDPQEWRAGASVAGVRATVMLQVSNGGICLMHDKSITVGALPGIIDDLRARGYTLVTLSELLAPGP